MVWWPGLCSKRQGVRCRTLAGGHLHLLTAVGPHPPAGSELDPYLSPPVLSPGRSSSRICVNARGFPPGPVCLLPACTTASEWGRAVLGGAGPLQTQTTALRQTGVPHPHSGHPAVPGQGPRSQLACLPSLQPWGTCFPQPQTVHSFTLEMVPRVYCVQATVLCVFN